MDIKTVSTVFGIDKNNADGSWYIYLEYEPWPDAQGIQYRKPATYPEIKAWVRHEYGMTVTDHHIAYIKRKHGIIMLVNPRGPLPEDINIPPEKETAIEAAFRHFGMI